MARLSHSPKTPQSAVLRILKAAVDVNWKAVESGGFLTPVDTFVRDLVKKGTLNFPDNLVSGFVSDA